MTCIWSIWCYYHPVISCISKIQDALSFRNQLTQVVVEIKAVNECCYYISCEAYARQNVCWSPQSVCLLSVCLSLTAFPQYCMQLDVSLENGSGCPLVIGRICNRCLGFVAVATYTYRYLYSTIGRSCSAIDGNAICTALSQVYSYPIFTTPSQVQQILASNASQYLARRLAGKCVSELCVEWHIKPYLSQSSITCEMLVIACTCSMNMFICQQNGIIFIPKAFQHVAGYTMNSWACSTV